jgi:hypothetical protein
MLEEDSVLLAAGGGGGGGGGGAVAAAFWLLPLSLPANWLFCNALFFADVAAA